MTGPEHYRAAEALLARVETESLDDGSVAELLGRALVHQGLASAAAVAMSHLRVMDQRHGDEWRLVATSSKDSLA